MKIEMLEQAVESYLKNVEGCLVTQTNWSLSNSLIKSKGFNMNFMLD